MRSSATRAALSYALLVGVWIFAFDLLVDDFIRERDLFLQLHLLSGGLTVAALFFLLRRELKAREHAQADLSRSYDEMEVRVEARTQQLTALNTELHKEIAERRRAEAEGQRLLAQYDRERRRAQMLAVEAQMRAEEQSAVFKAMTDAVIVYDAAGTPLRVNPAAQAALGVELPNAISRPEYLPTIQLCDSKGWPLPLEMLPSARALRGETVRGERLVLRLPDGRELKIMASASPLFSEGQVSGAVALWHNLVDHERLVALEERQRLARELHDSLSQALYGIALGAHTALTLLDTSRERVIEALDYVVALADAGLTEMRALIFDLRPESLAHEGLVNALVKQAAAVRARHGLAVATELDVEPEAPLETKEAIYRIAQQALHNAVKHAQAQRLTLRLRHEAGCLRLEVCDDGVGFDPDAPHPGHLGLRSMRERAANCKGTLQIDSAPGQGTRVRACFPVSGARAPGS